MPIDLLLTIGLSIVIVAVAAGLTARNRRARPAVMGAGLAAFVVGMYLTGLTQLAANGVRSLIDWFQRTPFTTVTAWGLGLLIGGIVTFVAGSFLTRTSRPREPKAEPQPQVQGQAAPQVAARPGGSVTNPTAAPKAAAPGKPAGQQQKGLDPEDAEIEALLRKRGIM